VEIVKMEKYDFTKEELERLSEQMAMAVVLKAEIEAEMKSVQAEYKKRIAENEAVIVDCAQKINAGFEMRPVNRQRDLDLVVDDRKSR